MPQSFVSFHHHLIFSTRNRLPLISSEVQPRLFAYIGGILRAEGCVLDAAGGMPDHVHLLVSLDKQLSLSEALRMIKASSSRWVHETFPAALSGFAWQVGYGAAGRGGSGTARQHGSFPGVCTPGYWRSPLRGYPRSWIRRYFLARLSVARLPGGPSPLVLGEGGGGLLRSPWVPQSRHSA
jgi:putative transposase